MVTALGSLLPKYDLAIVLEADPLSVHARKPELSIKQISEQQAAWLRLAPRVARSVERLQTGTSLDATTLALNEIVRQYAQGS